MVDTLPIGYQFSPSDEQLFFYYLAHRVRGDLSFSGFIPEFDVYEKEPWKFFDEDADRSLYVFTKIKMKKSRAERTAGSGFWKGVKTTDIEDHQGNIVGHKKHFNFKAKDGSSFERENAAKGSWIMHEYSMLKQEDHKTSPWFLGQSKASRLDIQWPKSTWEDTLLNGFLTTSISIGQMVNGLLPQWPLARDATASEFSPLTVEALEQSFGEDLREYVNSPLQEPNELLHSMNIG
ncbi:hypothetical protein NL676_002661 [Syzygium grande]|nr:hypothetical protein NL676_002661 [Syzygium grande]